MENKRAKDEQLRVFSDQSPLGVSEYEKVLLALKDSEERFQVLFEYAPDAYYLNDLSGRFLDGNIAAEKLIGYKREELIGKSFLKLKILPLSQIPKAAKHLALNTAGRASGPDEFTLIRKDGSRVEVEICTYPIKIKENRLVLGIARDITFRKQAERELQKARDELEKRVNERTAALAEANRQLDLKLEEYRRTEKALKKSEEKYRFITEWMADIVWTLDMDFNATYVSPSVKKVLGFTPEERKQQKLEETVTPESLERIMTRFSQEMRIDEMQRIDPNRHVTIEVEYYHRNGSTVWMENVVKAVRDKEGKIVGMHGVSRDITKRVHAQKELRAAELKYRTLVQNIPGMVYIGYPDWSAEIINDSTPICGYTINEINSLKEKWLSIIHPEDKNPVYEEASEILKAGEKYSSVVPHFD